MNQLRQRAGAAHRRRKREGSEERDPEATPSPAGPSSILSGGHINLFEDLERARHKILHLRKMLLELTIVVP